MNQETPVTDASASTAPSLPIWRLSVKQYHAMLAAGVLVSGDPVELLEGILVEKHGGDPSQFVAVDGELPPLPIWRLPPAQFDRMREVGIIERHDPVELCNCILVRKPK